METIYKFKGNIEGKEAICNVSECTFQSNKPNVMILPADMCTEESGIIKITKRDFNWLAKNHKIVYK